MNKREISFKISFIPFFIACVVLAVIKIVFWQSLSWWIVFFPLMIVGDIIGFFLLFTLAVVFTKWLQE